MKDHLQDFSELDHPVFEGLIRDNWTGKLNPSDLSALLEGEDARVLEDGRHRIVVISVNETLIAVKQFGKQKGWKDRADRKRGTKARRSLEAAALLQSNGVGTPTPLGVVDRWENNTLVESYYISEFLPDFTNLKDTLADLYVNEPRCKVLVSLLEHVAVAIRKMHNAGFIHRDLGNQNIQLRARSASSWGEVHLIDLNRGRIKSSLTNKERADDLSRLYLPSMFLRFFCSMYWQGEPPKGFVKSVEKAQRRFMLWHRTRGLRHPFRQPPHDDYGDYLPPQDQWVWDEESAQAAIMLNRRDRQRYYPWGRNFRMAWATLKNALPVGLSYRDLVKETFQKPVSLKGRIGMSLEATSLDLPHQLTLLKELGKMPVLLRFCHHEGAEQWHRSIADIKNLLAEGYDVMVALVQDRQAFLNLDSWESMCRLVFSEIGNEVSMVELCHAVNRTKWGLYSPEEQKALLERVVRVRQKYPDVPVSGPACIDFEYYHVFRALEETPDELHYKALSHHLYVDRRGAPENKQELFGTIEKAILLRAISRHAKQCDERVIVSETNWPVKGAGIYSPVDATYMYPGQPESDLNVSEEDYGYFMLRYLVLTLCSGHIEKVYWWRLVSHGFGLVDERAEGGWRARPGFEMLKIFLNLLGEATFVEKLDTEKDHYAFRFESGGQEIVMIWSNGKTAPLTQNFKQVLDVFGQPLEKATISDAPIYGLI